MVAYAGYRMSLIGVFITGAWTIGLEYHALPSTFVFAIWGVFATLALHDILISKTTSEEDYDINEYNEENTLSSMLHEYKAKNDNREQNQD